MAVTHDHIYTTDIHPIDIVENLATYHDWEFDRIADDQIAMAIEGVWRTYSLTLAWSQFDETLRLVCTFDMDPPKNRLPQLFEALNLVNDKCWTGGFSLWQEQKLMVWRYGLILSDGADANGQQINQMLSTAVSACEQFYPAFQLVMWSDQTAKEALNVAIAEAYGRA